MLRDLVRWAGRNAMMHWCGMGIAGVQEDVKRHERVWRVLPRNGAQVRLAVFDDPSLASSAGLVPTRHFESTFSDCRPMSPAVGNAAYI